MRRRIKALGFVIGAMMMVSTAAYAAQSDHSEHMAGAYVENTKEALPDEAREVFEKAMKTYKTDKKITPVRLLETQIVAGMNYRILCETERDYVYGKAILTIYKDLDGNCKVTDEQSVISPVRIQEKLSDTDFIADASFDASDFNWADKTLTFGRFRTVEYIAGAIGSIKPGELIEIDGKIVTVQTVEESETVRKGWDGKPERAAVITINKGTPDQQRFTAGEGGHWYMSEENDQPCYRLYAKVTLPLAENLKFTDRTSKPGETVDVPYEKLQSYMQEKKDQGDMDYNPGNTKVEVEHGKIMEIRRS